jgi:hypothetical protein
MRNNGEFCPAPLQIKHGVRPISLGKKGLIWLQLDDPLAKARMREKVIWVECDAVLINYMHGTSFDVSRKRNLDCDGQPKRPR